MSVGGLLLVAGIIVWVCTAFCAAILRNKVIAIVMVALCATGLTLQIRHADGRVKTADRYLVAAYEAKTQQQAIEMIDEALIVVDRIRSDHRSPEAEEWHRLIKSVREDLTTAADNDRPNTTSVRSTCSRLVFYASMNGNSVLLVQRSEAIFWPRASWLRHWGLAATGLSLLACLCGMKWR